MDPKASYSSGRGGGVIRRIAGVVIRPRATLVELVDRPAWAATWLFILIVWAICGGWLLSTDVGQQALVDERVRVKESVGGTLTDPEYAALLAQPPLWVYFTSGGRLLLTPEVTLLIAVVMWAVARRARASTRFSQALAIAVHSSVVLVIGQLVATPLHYVRESLTSPLNASAILPLMEDGTAQTRFFGVMDLFALWWAGLLAVGLSVLTGRPTRRFIVPIGLVFIGFAAVITTALAVMGGGS
jgi:Yip1 domain